MSTGAVLSAYLGIADVSPRSPAADIGTHAIIRLQSGFMFCTPFYAIRMDADTTGKNAKRQLEYVALKALIPYARNSRSHSVKQVANIAGSIKEFGFTNPVLVDADNGIIAGHGRVLAAELLGMDVVPCLRLSHLTETQKRAYVIADNQLPLGATWNEEMLALELEELSLSDFDLASVGLDTMLPSINHADAEAILQELGDSEEVNALTAGVRRGILIDFDLEDFEQAQDLIRAHRQAGSYVGGILLDALRQQQ